MIGRSRDVATPEELGQDERPNSNERPEPDRAHDVITCRIPDDDRYPGYEYDECLRCGATGRVGDLDPYEECEPQAPTAHEESRGEVPGEAGR